MEQEFTPEEQALMKHLAADSLRAIAAIFRQTETALEDGEITWLERARIAGSAGYHIMTLMPPYTDALNGGIDQSDIPDGLDMLAEKVDAL